MQPSLDYSIRIRGPLATVGTCRLHDNWKNNRGQLTPQTAMMLDNEKLRQAMALTTGMISMVDDAICNIMNNLWEDSRNSELRALLSLTLNHELTTLMDESPRTQHLA